MKLISIKNWCLIFSDTVEVYMGNRLRPFETFACVIYNVSLKDFSFPPASIPIFKRTYDQPLIDFSLYVCEYTRLDVTGV